MESWVNIAVDLVDSEVVWEAVAVGISFGLSSIFNHYYNSDKRIHEKVSKAKDFSLSKDFYDAVASNPVDFENVAVSGYVTADDKVLTSRYYPSKTGVISNFVIEEVKEIWGRYSNSWYERNKELSNLTETVPFSLTHNNVSVRIESPEGSPSTTQCLTDINIEFCESKNTTMESLMGFISGDRIKGFMYTEKMLLEGTRLLGIGKLFMKDNVLQLRKSTGCELLLTRQTKDEFVSSLAFKLKYWHILRIVAFGISLGGLIFFIKRVSKKYASVVDEQRRQNEITQLRELRERRSQDGSRNRNETDEVCVICLTNPRECIILNCGHVCSCVDCLENLPRPGKCPICRGSIDRVVPIFHA